MPERVVEVDRPEELMTLFGDFDRYIRLIEEAWGVAVVTRAEGLKLHGETDEAVEKAAECIRSLAEVTRAGGALTEQSVRYVISLVNDNIPNAAQGLLGGCLCVTAKGRPVRPKTLGQTEYAEAIGKNTITLGVGPAGTGKTYLAVAMAVQALKNKSVSRIILTRPAVEAGEKLGFLPGDLQNKVDPYLRPLYDALYDMLGMESYQKYLERGAIEVAPLAYMRGRTLDDSFIILDEAQNTTGEQMKMFLTRLGFNSKAVITGDVTQIDLPAGKRSGLVEAAKVLTNIEGIAICRLTGRDVVRHHLVQAIITAYEKYEHADKPRADRGARPAGGRLPRAGRAPHEK